MTNKFQSGWPAIAGWQWERSEAGLMDRQACVISAGYQGRVGLVDKDEGP